MIPGRQTITILRADLIVDPVDQSEYRDWPNATEIEIEGCSVQPFPMAEKLNFEENRDREYSQTAVRVYAPAGTRVEPTDRALYLGEEYQVFGHEGQWYQLTSGAEHHVQFILRKMEG